MGHGWLYFLDWLCFSAFRWRAHRPRVPSARPLKMDWTIAEERAMLDWAFAYPGKSCADLAAQLHVEPGEIRGYLGRRGITRHHIDGGMRHLWAPK